MITGFMIGAKAVRAKHSRAFNMARHDVLRPVTDIDPIEMKSRVRVSASFSGPKPEPMIGNSHWDGHHQEQRKPKQRSEVERRNAGKKPLRRQISFRFANLDISRNEGTAEGIHHDAGEKTREQDRDVKGVERIAGAEDAGNEHLLRQADDFNQARDCRNYDRGGENASVDGLTQPPDSAGDAAIHFHWLESGGRGGALGAGCHRCVDADAVPKLKHQQVPQLILMIDITAQVVINQGLDRRRLEIAALDGLAA